MLIQIEELMKEEADKMEIAKLYIDDEANLHLMIYKEFISEFLDDWYKGTEKAKAKAGQKENDTQKDKKKGGYEWMNSMTDL